jgi:hypothetical protein
VHVAFLQQNKAAWKSRNSDIVNSILAQHGYGANSNANTTTNNMNIANTSTVDSRSKSLILAKYKLLGHQVQEDDSVALGEPSTWITDLVTQATTSSSGDSNARLSEFQQAFSSSMYERKNPQDNSAPSLMVENIRMDPEVYNLALYNAVANGRFKSGPMSDATNVTTKITPLPFLPPNKKTAKYKQVVDETQAVWFEIENDEATSNRTKITRTIYISGKLETKQVGEISGLLPSSPSSNQHRTNNDSWSEPKPCAPLTSQM